MSKGVNGSKLYTCSLLCVPVRTHAIPDATTQSDCGTRRVPTMNALCLCVCVSLCLSVPLPLSPCVSESLCIAPFLSLCLSVQHHRALDFVYRVRECRIEMPVVIRGMLCWLLLHSHTLVAPLSSLFFLPSCPPCLSHPTHSSITQTCRRIIARKRIEKAESGRGRLASGK